MKLSINWSADTEQRKGDGKTITSTITTKRNGNCQEIIGVGPSPLFLKRIYCACVYRHYQRC